MVSPPLTRPPDPVARSVVPSRSVEAPAGRRWSLRRTHVVVGTGATAVAVWLGVTAPSVSPVAPPAPIAAAVTAAPTTAVDPVPGATAAVPPDPAVVGGPGDGRGRGR